MGTITKQDAAILFAYSFKLVDKEGREHDIAGVNDVLMLKNNIWVEFNQIGTDYWILKRPYSQLTKSIVVDGKLIYPIIELAKIEYPELLEPKFIVDKNLRAVDIYDEGCGYALIVRISL